MTVHCYVITGFLDAIVQLSKIDELMKEEANNLREIIEILHLKHKEYTDEIQTYVCSHLMDQTEIKRLSGLLGIFFPHILKL